MNLIFEYLGLGIDRKGKELVRQLIQHVNKFNLQDIRYVKDVKIKYNRVMRLYE